LKKPVKKSRTETITDENTFKILLLCFQELDFCQKASTALTPKPDSSESMQKTYESLTAIFSSLARSYEIIANWMGYKLDFSSEKGKIVLEKINRLSELDEPQRKKCMKEISSLLANNK